MDRQYSAFISYRHADLDSAVAKTLHTLIEQYRIPKDLHTGSGNRLGIVFRDEEELHAASDLSAEITNALDNSRFLIVICSENTLQSPWVPREIETFLKTHDRSRILTVLASGNPADVFPHQLTRLELADGSFRQIEPLAVDVRGDRISAVLKKLRRELPRLVSAMLGCPYDALVMREQKRRSRRILAVAAGAMAVLLGFSSMLFVKNRQIEQRNEELARQKAEVQLRESQLLTQDAREALDNGDYTAAITQAVAALPKPGEENRPYHAPAEGLLMEALNLFTDGEPPVILNTTELTQMTEISEFCISEDGEQIFTVDAYGLIHGFSARDGQVLWKRAVSPVPGYSQSSGEHLKICGDRLLSSYRGTLEARNLRTGDTLWSRELPDCPPDYLFYHRERDILVLLEITRNEDYMPEGYLLVLSAETGDTLHRLPLADRENAFPIISIYTAKTFRAGGNFSADGTLFAGALLDDSGSLYCFTADLTALTAEIFYSHGTPGTYRTTITALDLREDEGKLLLTAHCLPDTDVASALMLDTNTGELLWQTDIAGNPHSYSFAYDESLPHIASKLLLLGFYDHIYHIELESGTVVSRENVGGVLTYLDDVNDYSFGYAMRHGTYGLGWMYNDGTMAFSSGADYQVYATLPPHRTLKVWGGGIVQLKADGGLILSVSNVVEPGYVAVIPEDTANVIRIVRPVQLEPAVERGILEMPETTFYADSNCGGHRTENRLILGPMRVNHPDSYETDMMYMALDPETREILGTWHTDQYLGSSRLYWLPDSLSVIRDERFGTVVLTEEDGTERILTERGDAIAVSDGIYYDIADLICSASAYQKPDAAVLTAKTTPDSLCLWRNGVQEQTVPLPPQLCCTPQDCSGKTRFLAISENGHIFVTLHDSEGPVLPGNWAVFDSGSGTWLELPFERSIPATANLTFSEQTSQMAVLDSDGTVHILNLSGGEEAVSFPGLVPGNAVAQLSYALEDSCLVLKTRDGKYLIFDVSDGRVLYEDQVNSYGSGFRVYEDPENRRLYLSSGLHNSDPDSICIDLRSWTRLSYLDGLLYFDGQTGILYQHNTAGIDALCVYSQIPGTAELVELGRSMVE